MSKYLELVGGSLTQEHLDKQKNQKPYVAYSIKDDNFIYSIAPKPVVDGPWVTFTAEEDSSSIGLTTLSTNQTLEYSTDTATWSTFDTTTNISLNNGDKVYVRGMLSADNTDSNYTQFKMTGKIAASGNCNALWNYEDFNASLKNYCGYSMFDGCTSLTSTPELPATTLAASCYRSMFSNCTSLTSAPELPATTLAAICYRSMFSNCTSLTSTPELPATTLAGSCYHSMFYNCTSLTSAPELPATTLVGSCYNSMFSGCTSLTTAPELLATTLASQCYLNMFAGCTSLTAAPELPATMLDYRCYENMFGGCTSLTTAPELPAYYLDEYCYEDMFNGCTSLNYIKCLRTNFTYPSPTNNWVYKVSSTGTFVKYPDVTGWSIGASGIPSGWTVVDAEL